MKKAILGLTAAAIVGAATLVPSAPASAYIWVPMMLEMKKDKNFKATAQKAPAKRAAPKRKMRR